jgi:molecular chaperone DnaK (HSP70)
MRTLSLFGIFGLLGIVSSDILSIDLGSQFFKVALVSTGKFEIVPNLQSKRKTPTAVSFKSKIREFGDDALLSQAKNPSKGMLQRSFALSMHSCHIVPMVEWCKYDTH